MAFFVVVIDFSSHGQSRAGRWLVVCCVHELNDVPVVELYVRVPYTSESIRFCILTRAGCPSSIWWFARRLPCTSLYIIDSIRLSNFLSHEGVQSYELQKSCKVLRHTLNLKRDLPFLFQLYLIPYAKTKYHSSFDSPTDALYV